MSFQKFHKKSIFSCLVIPGQNLLNARQPANEHNMLDVRCSIVNHFV